MAEAIDGSVLGVPARSSLPEGFVGVPRGEREWPRQRSRATRRPLAVALGTGAMLTTSSALVVFSAPHVVSPEFLGVPAMIAVLGFAIIWILAALALLEWYLFVLPNGRLADDFRDAEACCETLMPLTVGLLTLLAIYVLDPAARSSFQGLLLVGPGVRAALNERSVLEP